MIVNCVWYLSAVLVINPARLGIEVLMENAMKQFGGCQGETGTTTSTEEDVCGYDD
jgi:hypothetical protein